MKLGDIMVLPNPHLASGIEELVTDQYERFQALLKSQLNQYWLGTINSIEKISFSLFFCYDHQKHLAVDGPRQIVLKLLYEKLEVWATEQKVDFRCREEEGNYLSFDIIPNHKC